MYVHTHIFDRKPGDMYVCPCEQLESKNTVLLIFDHDINTRFSPRNVQKIFAKLTWPRYEVILFPAEEKTHVKIDVCCFFFIRLVT